MNEKIKLSKRELDVMNVLWEMDKPATAKDIESFSSELSINTIIAVLKSLLKRGFIKVSDIVYSGTVLTRSYEYILTADDYMINQITKGFKKKLSPDKIVAALLSEEYDEETIESLEKLINQYKDDLNKRN
jgi:predicted transcriptional regulator